tara:strand:+ start:1308 stop:3587 length:2280 start_codon:yes stop_codon:yes gene_type:complete
MSVIHLNWQSLLKAGMPNWKQAVKDDNIPDKLNLEQFSNNEINTAHNKLEQLISEMRNKQSDFYKQITTTNELRGRVGYKPAKINAMIKKLIEHKNLLKEPMPENIASLKFKNKAFKNAFPRGDESWVEWVQDTTNTLYQDFAGNPTLAKLTVLGQFLTRLKTLDAKGGKKRRPENLFQNWKPSPDTKEEFTRGLNKFSIDKRIPTGIFEDIRNQFDITAGKTEDVSERPVKTRVELETGQAAQSPKLEEAFKEGKKKTKKQRKRAAEQEKQTKYKEKKRKVRGGRVIYGKDESIPTRVSPSAYNKIQDLPYREFTIFMNSLHKANALKDTPLMHFKDRGLRILHQIITLDENKVSELVMRIDEIRKGITHRTEKRGQQSNFIYTYIKNEMRKNKDKTVFEFLDVDKLLGENTFNKLMTKRREAPNSLTGPQEKRLENHFDAVETLFDKIRKELNTGDTMFRKAWQHYVRQKANADADAKELMEELREASEAQAPAIRDKIRNIYSKMDLEERPDYALFGITDGVLKSKEIEEAFNLLDTRFAKGIFVTMYFKYWELEGTEWDRQINKWVPSTSGWTGYWPTGRIFQNVDSNTFPQSFKALLTIIQAFSGTGTMQRYSNSMQKMMNEFIVNMDKTVMTLSKKKGMISEKNKKRNVAWMVEEKTNKKGLNGKQQILELHPNLSQQYDSCMGIKDNLMDMENKLDSALGKIPKLINSHFNDILEKISTDEITGTAKLKGQSQSLKEKLINMDILIEGDEEE